MKFGRVVAVLVAVLVGLLGVVPAASAAPEQWKLKSEWDSGMLDHNFTDGVHTRPSNAGPYQNWEVKRYADGTYRFMNVATKMCLDNSEHGVRGFGCNDGSWQRWRVNHWGNGTYEILSAWNNHCLDNSVYGVRTFGCNGLNHQRWTLWAP
ncbi:RICIN domain-containing protein [Saccharothrix sp. NRRL B-16348]|uniref:RICIN domain-containing protein n=1 Tax=Saccharothrix sp. NRRL B-16348 TaxID=1415542 RepID=UPI0006AE4AD1|nr:RICIN domain-containing protein [Saccharothrix sp. NRRL B-16348]